MSKEYFVIRGSKVVYAPGHYDEFGALQVARTESQNHPKAIIRVVKVISEWQGVPKK